MQLAGKNIAVIGFGVTGQSCARFLLSQQANVTVFDTRDLIQAKSPVTVILGEIPVDALVTFDAIIVSPGVSLTLPAIVRAKDQGIEVIGDIELFARFASCPIVAITGSNGKSTVVDMLGRIYLEVGMNVGVGGNIGTPALDLLADEYQLIVLELSSFQLETCQSLKPYIASILNVSEDHLDRHGNLDAYRAAKQRIYQQARFCVANALDSDTLPVSSEADYVIGAASEAGIGINVKDAVITLDGKPIIASSELQVAGLHNLLNAQAALLISLLTDVSLPQACQSIKNYLGLPHRCQKVRTWRDVLWIDDSKATNVGATIAGITGIKSTITGDIILLAGGDSKQADLSPLQPILQQDVKHLIVFGKDAPLLAELKAPLCTAESLQQAVEKAAEVAQAGDAVLLSPACASYDMFDNFSHRGRCFQEAVGALI
ncbi:MAG: UDP-N-acetylmuramoyl-L-alanine--D-glutamate ligase [Aestuariibacter sp.]